MRPLLAVDGLSIRVGARPLLHDVSFCLRPGEVLTLLGESGAGKSLLAQAVMGNLPSALRASGTVTLDGSQSRAEDAPARRPRWGRTLALLPQEPSLALDPLMHVGRQLRLVHELVNGLPAHAASAKEASDLQRAGLAHAAQHHPWQISGGMAQRAAAVIALAGGARILLADEPTKGLDSHWRDQTVAMLQAVQREGGCVVVITHDLRVAHALGGQLMVLRAGEVVEQGEARTVLAHPQHDFTRQLVAAEPVRWPRRAPPRPGEAVLTANGLTKRFGDRRVFDGIDLQVRSGERFVLQGPSGTGKSTLGNVLLGVLQADKGTVQRAPHLAPTALQKLYQDPVASFAPRISLGRSLRDVARRHGRAWSEVMQRLTRLGIAEDLLARLPGDVSGGELQRVALTRVLTAQPALLFADEPTSRLDPVSQRDAMNVLLDEVDQSGAALLLVTHDDDMAQAVGTKFLRLDASMAWPCKRPSPRVDSPPRT